MSLDEAFRAALLGHVPELAAQLREELGKPRMLPTKGAPVSHRAILAAEKRGELAVYRPPHTNGSFVDEQELWDWIKRSGTPKAAPEPEPADDVDALIVHQDSSRKRRIRAA